MASGPKDDAAAARWKNFLFKQILFSKLYRNDAKGDFFIFFNRKVTVLKDHSKFENTGWIRENSSVCLKKCKKIAKY